MRWLLAFAIPWCGFAIPWCGVDFGNRDYDLYRLTDGEGELREYDEDGRHDTTLWHLEATEHATLDGQRVHVVLITGQSWSTSGNLTYFYELWVFDERGDRIAKKSVSSTQAKGLAIEQDTIVVKVDADKERWRLVGGALVTGAGGSSPETR